MVAMTALRLAGARSHSSLLRASGGPDIERRGVFVELIEPCCAKEWNVNGLNREVVGWKPACPQHADRHPPLAAPFKKKPRQILRIHDVSRQELVETPPDDTAKADANIRMLPACIDRQFLRSNDGGTCERFPAAIGNQPFGKPRERKADARPEVAPVVRKDA